MALEYRYEFGSDAVVDLIGFRRHGHSEVDDPTITQPILYRKIKDHPMLYQIYARKSVSTPSRTWKSSRPSLTPPRAPARAWPRSRPCASCPATGRRIMAVLTIRQYEVDTGLPAEKLQQITDGLAKYPEDFHIHPKVQKLLEQRREMGYGKRPLDFGMAEALAFGSLGAEGTADSFKRPGQPPRHLQSAAFGADRYRQDEKEYVPLCHLAPGQARVEIYNSELSEAAVLGFEYGLCARLSRGAGDVGGAVRRLRQRRANHHRPVHRGWRG